MQGRVRSLEERLNKYEENIARSEEFSKDSMSDILQRKIRSQEYDVFLSYSLKDRQKVEEIAEKLRQQGILPQLEHESRLGSDWGEIMTRVLANVKAVLVFVGKDEVNQWQKPEIRSLLRDSVRRGLPVIPAILEGVDAIPQTPIFLGDVQFVEFREDFETTIEEILRLLR